MRQMKKMTIILTLLFLLVLAGCANDSESEKTAELTVSAAASMTDSLLEVKEAFEKEHPAIKISYNFGGSGALRKQIEQGAPIDLFFSASKTDYDKLVKQDMVQDGTAIFQNELVLIKSNQTDLNSRDDLMQQGGSIAVGTPDAVPAGTYAKEVLGNIGVWEELQDRQMLVFTKDVSQVVTLVSQGAVDVGIVYASDVIARDDVTVIDRFDPSLHATIEYYATIIESEEQQSEVMQAREAFYQYVLENEAKDIFRKYGFLIME